ncbi:uncharacterized protein LOC142333690 isoform X2 [Lycorma delicatula]|uniref:uncharacterized protein LOC142333690 isoform X2 n=1 Tax=Lycorma delicatula TaxID=130591 RepID=UPI003F51113F
MVNFNFTCFYNKKSDNSVRLLHDSNIIKMEKIICVLLFLCIRQINFINSFNVDTLNYVKHTGQEGSMFGFSVAEHKERGYSWVLVGAPQADTRQPGVHMGGAVYRCDINRDDACQEIVFDPNGNNNFSDGSQMDQKSYQWFGATVKSSGEDGRVVACAPRYVYFSSSGSRRDPVGTCFVASKDFSDIAEYPPCRTRNWGYHRQGSCQAGLGADFSKNGQRLYIGAVGSWYWQGQLHSIDTNARLPFPVPPRISVYVEGQIFSQNIYSRPDVISTLEGPATDDDSYLGYSVTTGDFGGGNGQTDVAAGMPRGAGLLGKVVLYTWNMTNLQNITGEQLGAYFGYSLCSTDIDGDKLDDLVIGAPLHTDFSNNEGSYETGRVYFVYQGKESYRFRQRWHIRDGKNSKARFGLAVAALGDINKDGFGDVAVGAPYDGPFEQGAVYIYHGSPEGIRDKPSQVIMAEQISNRVSTFGFSLAGGHDLDNNQYPDLVVGAYESDTTVFLRARPVVKMQATVNFNVESKQVILEEKNCTLKDNTWVPCLPLDACLEYNGIGVDNTLDFDIQLILDSKKTKSPRMFFLSDEGRNVMNQTLRIEKSTPLCKSMFVYLKPSIRDKLTALEAEMRYSLRGEKQWAAASTRGGRRYPRSLFPILDHNEPLMRKDSISIQKNCGKDNICIPDLRLTSTPSVKRYLLGSDERLMIDVYVENNGEDSFESILDMSVPPGLNYVKIERIDTEREIPVQCSAPSFLNNHTLHCDIGNPLPREKHVHFKVLLQPFHKEGMKPRYEFFITVNSTNPENKTTTDDNSQQLTVPIWVETDIVLSGSSQPPDVRYNISLYDTVNITQESEIGPQVIHTYNIRNKGPSDILEAETIFLWPSYTLGGDHLLYLLDQPQTNGPVKCEFVEHVNVEKVRLDRKRKAYLQQSASYNGIQSSLTSTGQSGIVIEEYEQGSSSSSSSLSTSSSSSSAAESSLSSSSSKPSKSGNKKYNGNKLNNKKIELTAEERRKLEDIERRKDEEELLAETGDGSFRHSKRIKESRYNANNNVGNTGEHTESGNHHLGGGTTVSGSSFQDGRYISERGRVEKSGSSNTGGGGLGFTYAPGGLTFSSNADSSGRHVEEEIARRYGASNVYNGNRRISNNRNTDINDKYNNRNYNSNNSRNYGLGSNYGATTSNINQDSNTRNQFNIDIDKNTNRHMHTDMNIDSSVGEHSINIIPNGERGVYSKEEHHYRNSSWNSADGGQPKTYETSDWSVNNNGTIRNGSSNSYVDHGGSIEEDLGMNIDRSNSGSTRVHSTEEHKQRNTTWNSLEGKPKTYETTNWRINENGNVKNGSYTNIYVDGDNIGRDISSTSLTDGYDSSKSQYGTNTGRQSSSTSSSHDVSQSQRGQYDVSSNSANHQTSSSVTGSSYDDASHSRHDQYDASHSHRGQFDASAIDRQTSYDRSNNYDYNQRAGHHSEGGLSSSTSQSFDNLAAIAKGPGDGVAKTYSFDVLNNKNSDRQSSGGRNRQNQQSSSDTKQYAGSGSTSGWASSSGSGSGSSSRHYQVSSNNQVGNGDHWKHAESSSSNNLHTQDGSYSSSSYNRDHASQHYNSEHGGYNNEDEESGVRGKFKLYPRYKRQVDSSGEINLEDSLKCGPTKCTKIKCTIGPLTRDQEVWIAFRSRIWVQTLKKFAYNPDVQVSSMVGGRVLKLPHIGSPDQTAIHTKEVVTDIQPREVAGKTEVVPLWVVVLSACAGAIILMLLVYLLYKCGFFKRNRPSDAPEKEPLNRNGHYQSGDEAL